MPYKKAILWSLTILWMALLFYFSSQPAAVSKGQSGRVMMVVRETLKIPEKALSDQILQFIIRKSGHITGYFILGILMTLSVSYIDNAKHVYPLSLGLCILYAISDEIHQTFVPGRSGEVRDVMLDALGALAAVLVVYGVRKVKGLRRA